MSIFGSIMSKIFGHSQAAQPGATPAGEAAAQGGSRRRPARMTTQRAPASRPRCRMST